MALSLVIAASAFTCTSTTASISIRAAAHNSRSGPVASSFRQSFFAENDARPSNSPSTSASCLPSPRISGRAFGRNSSGSIRRESPRQKVSCRNVRSLSNEGGGQNGPYEALDELGASSLRSSLLQQFSASRESLSRRISRRGSLEHRVSTKAKHKGRVGTYKREGNVALASFDTNVKAIGQGTEGGDITKSLSKLLPFVVAATAIAALSQPASFSWVTKEYYAPALGGIMLSIGVQLSLADFALVLKRPLPVLIGYVAQYIVKPLLGFMIVRLFNVPAAFSSGLILTACVAGAQLSSYASFLGNGDVALSIILTSLTTISSVAVTPLLTRILIGSAVPLNLLAMASSILQVVIAPVFLGLTLNTYAKPLVDKVRAVMPLVAMVCTSLCIGSPLALNRGRILSSEGLQLMFPVLAFHIGAFILGYWITRIPLWRVDEKESRTISLCTGMQSSTLAMLLASQFLGAANAVPAACSVVVMALMGLSIASFWARGNQVGELVSGIVTECNERLAVTKSMQLLC